MFSLAVRFTVLLLLILCPFYGFCCMCRLRLQEGFHFIHTHHGILSLALELDMQVLCHAVHGLYILYPFMS